MRYLTEESKDEQAIYRNAIVENTNKDEEYGWFNITYEGIEYNLPERAMLWYMYGNVTALRDVLPPYQAVSRREMKLPLDNQYHTDVGEESELLLVWNN